VVRGLDVFREYFAGHADQFVLIGGTAATLAMEDAGLEFRATKDLDIVLHIEALRASFGGVFWSFIEAGGYEIRQASDTGKPVFYRFQKPSDERFPAMLELFCRAPDGIKLAEHSRLTPVPIDEAAASLSAILLDDAYYDFILAGRKGGAVLPWVGEDRLIPLKAVAWLDLGERQAKGESVDSAARTSASTPTTCCACLNCSRRTFVSRSPQGSRRIFCAFSMGSNRIARSIQSPSGSTAALPSWSNALRRPMGWIDGARHDHET
jgi:hypothetical protein